MGSNSADRWGEEEQENCKNWEIRCWWKGRFSLLARQPKDICLPCLSTERGRRCGDPRRFLSRYTLSTSPWCRVVLLVSNPDDWKGVWETRIKSQAEKYTHEPSAKTYLYCIKASNILSNKTQERHGQTEPRTFFLRFHYSHGKQLPRLSLPDRD